MVRAEGTRFIRVGRAWSMVQGLVMEGRQTVMLLWTAAQCSGWSAPSTYATMPPKSPPDTTSSNPCQHCTPKPGSMAGSAVTTIITSTLEALCWRHDTGIHHLHRSQQTSKPEWSRTAAASVLVAATSLKVSDMCSSFSQALKVEPCRRRGDQ